MAGETTSLGEFLRQEREKRGITIEQVASATKVSVRLLYSLEADEYVDLPAKPFIRGFVTSYVRFINLDPKEVLTRFGGYIDSRALDRPTRDGGHSGYAFEKRDGEQSRTILWAVMGTFIVLGTLVVLVFKPSMKHHRHGHMDQLREANPTASDLPVPVVSGVPVISSTSPSGVPSAVVALPAPAPAPAPSAVPSAQPTPKPSATPTPAPSASPAALTKPDPLNSGANFTPAQIKHKVVFKALEDVWVRYRVDGKPLMKFVLRKDRILVLRGQEDIKFQVSDPASISFKYNGSGTQVLNSSKNVTTHNSNASIAFPPQAVEKLEETFNSEAPLPTSVPSQ
ncbi:MAG: helix-turn-helix domain-containing protein [Methylotenera sp.]|nr:helix-turn-helix domain-containing protein [Oligoflexia bacterium]